MKKTLLAIITAAALAGCFKTNDNNTSCEYNECAVKAPETEIQTVRSYLAQNNINAVEHCSGLFYVVDSVGTGATPTVCSGISVRYKGMLTNGVVFDSSNVSTPYWALGNLIRGWINGIPQIKQGGGIRLYIPPTLGYGAQAQTDRNGNVVIPANSMLIFEVKLDGVVQ